MKIVNRSYNREYEEIEKYEAGIALTGGEVKVVQQGGIKLEGSFVKLRDDGAYLLNAEIPPYQYARDKEYDPKRSRRVLLHQEELERLRSKIASAPSLTIVPIACYNKGRLLKLEIALSRGRKDLEKRKREKARDVKRAQEKEAKEYTRG
ncbi:SsrA-binding protein SmpB [Candidatus Roizmanbacteria bacterium]|nr:SsrA-binding protein SmpB [Candidatus Roizmanbacteria bacterium]